MKKLLSLLLICAMLALCSGCAQQPSAQIAATTLPVYEFTSRLCEHTDLTVTRLVTESVSCLHDYSLNVRQVRSAEAAELIVISGAGLEEFMEDLLHDKAVVDSSAGIELMACEDHHDHGHHGHDHHHDVDNHIWLAPENAKIMASNICTGLSARYPEYAATFQVNLAQLVQEIDELQTYGEKQLMDLSCRELITFHDGFSYLAQSFGLTILKPWRKNPAARLPLRS